MSVMDPVDLSMRLIEYPSVTASGNDKEVLDFVEKTLSSMGFVCERFLLEESGTDPVDNLYAKFGTELPNFCFAGHLDVVPPGDLEDWRIDPFKPEIIGDSLYGRGACDMKCAVGCFISSVSKFIEDFSGKGSISLMITCDEEGPAINGTKKVFKLLEERGEVVSDCLIGEPTTVSKLGDSIKIGRRGSVNFTLEVTGKQGHVAYPDLATNPIDYLVDILHKIKEEPLDSGNDYFSPSNLEIVNLEVNNFTTNVIPGKAKGFFNVRFNNHYEGKDIVKIIDDICSSTLKGTKVSYNLKSNISGEPFLSKPCKFHDIVVSSISNLLSVETDVNTKGGTSDARFIRNYCNVAEFGLSNATAHQIDENVLVEDIRNLSDVYLDILRNYFK